MHLTLKKLTGILNDTIACDILIQCTPNVPEVVYRLASNLIAIQYQLVFFSVKIAYKDWTIYTGTQIEREEQCFICIETLHKLQIQFSQEYDVFYKTTHLKQISAQLGCKRQYKNLPFKSGSRFKSERNKERPSRRTDICLCCLQENHRFWDIFQHNLCFLHDHFLTPLT